MEHGCGGRAGRTAGGSGAQCQGARAPAHVHTATLAREAGPEAPRFSQPPAELRDQGHLLQYLTLSWHLPENCTMPDAGCGPLGHRTSVVHRAWGQVLNIGTHLCSWQEWAGAQRSALAEQPPARAPGALAWSGAGSPHSSPRAPPLLGATARREAGDADLWAPRRRGVHEDLVVGRWAPEVCGTEGSFDTRGQPSRAHGRRTGREGQVRGGRLAAPGHHIPHPGLGLSLLPAGACPARLQSVVSVPPGHPARGLA